MHNLTYVEVENEVLRQRLADLKAAARDLCVSVEEYVRQRELRSALLIKKDNLKSLLK